MLEAPRRERVDRIETTQPLVGVGEASLERLNAFCRLASAPTESPLDADS